MIPRKLTLSGAIGIKAGLGRESITLDLDSIAGDALTIAICGDNGSGKSTIMNLAMVPWLNPPLPGNTSIYDHFGPEGIRELWWTHGTGHYHSLIKYRQTPKAKTTRAILQQENPKTGLWEPARTPDGTVSDGKGTTYEACLRSILGAQSVYYLSAFRQQGAPHIGEYADPKALMRDLLGLEKTEKDVARAQEVVRGIRAARTAIAGDITKLHENRLHLDRYRASAVTLSGYRADIDQKIADTEQQLRTKRSELQRIEDAIAAQAEHQQRRRELTDQISEAATAWRESIDAIDAEIARAEAIARKRAQDARRSIDAHRQNITRAEARIVAYQQTLEQETQIRQAIANLPDIIDQRDKLATELATIEEDHRQLADLVLQRTRIAGTISRVNDEIRTITGTIADLAKRHGYVEQVPCHGEGQYASCPALADAIAAADKIPDHQTRMAEAQEANAKHKEQYDELISRIDGYGDVAAKIAEMRTMIARTEASLTEATRLADRASALESASQGMEEEAWTITEQSIEIATIEQTAEEEASAEKAATEARWKRREAATQVRDLRVARIQAMLDAIPTPDTSGAGTLKSECAVMETWLAGYRTQLEETITQAARIKELIESTERNILDGESVESRDQALADTLATWTLLVTSLRGAIDMSIEDAGPGIAAITNQLLESAYGPRFAVRIATQRVQENGRLVECFRIMIYDAQTDQDSPLSLKSGGQTVWISKAISDAVGIYQQDAAGVHYECLFSDEADDGLTQDRKRMFWAMDRAALEAGGFTRRIFVSHTPAAIEMADTVINMDNLAR